MYILFQAVFTVATLALTVPIFLSYKFHVVFQILKVCASIWNGGSFLLEVMPRQVVQKEKRKLELQPIPASQDQPKPEPLINGDHENDPNVAGVEALANGEHTDYTSIEQNES